MLASRCSHKTRDSAIHELLPLVKQAFVELVHNADKDQLPHPCTDQQQAEWLELRWFTTRTKIICLIPAPISNQTNACLDLASRIVMASRVQQRQDGAATNAHASIREKWMRQRTQHK